MTFTVQFIVSYFMWHVSTDSSFTHLRSEASVTAREGRPNAHSVIDLIPFQLLTRSCQLKSQPDFPLTRLMNISADKQATWLSAQKQCVVSERSLVLATVMYIMYMRMHACLYTIIMLQFKIFTFCLNKHAFVLCAMLFSPQASENTYFEEVRCIDFTF